jgi:sialidase-1
MPGKARAEILWTRTICKQPARYIGWPTIVRTRDNELLAAFSGDRDQHVCPYGKTQMVRSRDDGQTWSAPETINDTPLDDRDAGVLQTARGTLLVSWFTSTCFADHAESCRKWCGDKMVDGWKDEIARVTPKVREECLGNWVRRSTDGGRTWGEQIRNHVSSPHGPIQLKDGRLLYVGVNAIVGDAAKGQVGKVAAEVSSDDGQSWRVLSEIPSAPADAKKYFCEPHVVETASGKLVCLSRVEEVPAEEKFLYQSESLDGGKTWSELKATAIWGLPPHLLRLANGWLLVVYGHRRKPFGERACLNYDEGRSWDVENVIELAGAPNGDLGYPASTQLSDGSLLTVFYQAENAGEKTCLMATRWRLEGK